MKQETALQIMKSGKNVFLTGSAGTGKTYTLNTYIAYLKKHRVPVAITASTGIAATHMNGTTIHSWSGIGIKDEMTHAHLKGLESKKYLLKHIEKTNVLIIDEISMLHKNQLDMVNQSLKFLKRNQAPFGGMQVIFAGDFFQLPPVTKEQETAQQKFAFMSKAWQEAAPTICYLTEQFRQTHNNLNRVLNQIRNGEVNDETVELLMESKENTHTIEPTRLYSHNADVDRINQEELEKIDDTPHAFFATKKGNMKMIEGFVKSLIVPEKLSLKKSAKVMFLKNNHDLDIYNGTLGEVVSFFTDPEDNEVYPVVKLSDKRKITVKPEMWSIDNEKGSPLVSVTQIPLRLAWAITVHKSQGMTLEAAEIDLGKAFEPGQGYVALSRLKDISGLRLLGINRMALEVDPLAMKADKRFQELSQLAEKEMNIKELENEAKTHVLNSGGTLDSYKINQPLKNGAIKGETYKISFDLLKEHKSLEKVAEIRGLALSTIMSHIMKIRDMYPNEDLSFLKPKPAIFNEIEEAHKEVLKTAKEEDFSKDGRLNSALLFEKLKGKYDYGTIKLTLAFL